MCIRDRAMTIYRSGHYSMKFSKSIQRQLVEVQKDFMPEDTEAGQIQGFLEHYTGSMVCSKPVSYTHLDVYKRQAGDTQGRYSSD